MDYDEIMSRQNSPPAPGDDQRRVIGWVAYDSVETRDVRQIGGWGGCIKCGDRWSDYVEDLEAGLVPYLEALRKDIIENRLRRGGDWHQMSPDGVPVFDDGAVGMFSCRAWGDLVAAIWASEDGRDYEYMDFYMDQR